MSTEVKQAPQFEYAEGYIPQSLDAPHSSLQTVSLWLGMFLFLTGIAASGFAIFGGATAMFDTQEHGMTFLYAGIGLAVLQFILAFVFISIGRRGVKKYRKENPMAEMH